MSTNYNLGLEIHQLLQENNLENYINWNSVDRWSDGEYAKELEEKLAVFLQHFGIDLDNSSMCGTPKRMVCLFMKDLFWGLDYHNFPDISFDNNTFAYTNPLISKNIQLKSTCEHHMVAINGYATVAYIPGKKVVGLGKLNQIVSFFAHRPQMQERLTNQVCKVLQYLLDTQDVAVAINAHHGCINRGGISDSGNMVLSFALGGKFLSDNILNSNFYNLCT